eukprot:jgi/Hompol1/4997/HPOL_001099-RA
MSSVKLLKEEDENDAEVTHEDQLSINMFSKLNIRLEYQEEIYDGKKKEREYLEDLSSELELADEDELIKYRIGDAYVSIPLPQAMERIKVEQEALDGDLGAVSTKISEIKSEMSRLKALLYAKFGKSINLEKD